MAQDTVRKYLTKLIDIIFIDLWEIFAQIELLKSPTGVLIFFVEKQFRSILLKVYGEIVE